jgi:hypothetical protein
MPSALTYPGVYVEEISSGVRTITGVATSITAFIGRAKRGPVDEATTINSFGDYERIFGGLDLNSTMSYAVRDYYLNGGAQAVIVRLFNANSDEDNGKAKITIDSLVLEAASPGSWGNDLHISIDLDVAKEVAERIGLTQKDLFNLTITDGKASEKYLNITVLGDSERRIDKVLAASSLMRLSGKWPEDVSVIDKIKGKIKEFSDAEKAVQDAEKALAYAAAAEKGTKKTDLDTAKETLDKIFTKGEGNDGQALTVDDYTAKGAKKGLYVLEEVDLFNLLCIPPYTETNDVEPTLIDTAAKYCEDRRAMLIVDPHSTWKDKTKVLKDSTNGLDKYILTRSKNAALFFPRLKQPNPLNDNRMEKFVPCGAVAGIMARTDTQRGVWKAPAGIDATLRGVPELSVKLTDAENGELNPLGVNCLRSFPNIGRVIWGARTLRGADKYPTKIILTK